MTSDSPSASPVGERTTHARGTRSSAVRPPLTPATLTSMMRFSGCLSNVSSISVGDTCIPDILSVSYRWKKSGTVNLRWDMAMVSLAHLCSIFKANGDISSVRSPRMERDILDDAIGIYAYPVAGSKPPTSKCFLGRLWVFPVTKCNAARADV